MMSTANQPFRWFVSLIVLTCAITQSWILHHELVDCLPFKVMSLSQRYGLVANIAKWIGPITAVAAALFLSFIPSRIKCTAAISIAAALVCPFVFTLSFRLLTPTPGPNLQAPDFSTQVAWLSFLQQAFLASAAGLICSGPLVGLSIFLTPRWASPSA
jgi:hypothetical protein